ncbi:o-succinylbenzoate synthase [Mobilicoccus pelagius]|uniref:o-succinylbenzoate synthase n=1 Tax=Mobilicoccus pelagius NBRC 104925 TaxID=1089455 RepID=H5UUA4_9MICO|nr:o-succinylbenzoate synthase [Mobilicoccus pelagius]GAB49312.1 o-succinylbenzoate synthase [Mobilicoccus pelagius NBRC 104925]
MDPVTLPDLPDLPTLLDAAHVVRIPMRTRFRGLTARETVVFEGPCGWGEFGAFGEYDDAEASRWLAAGLEAAWRGHPAPVRRSVPVNATVPAIEADRVPEIVARFGGAGTAKVKVAERGQSLGDDVARVAAVRDVMGPAGRVRVDANGGWSVDEALDAITALAPYDLEYVEQPCMDVEDLARVRVGLARRGLEVRVAADESIRRAEDPLRVKQLDAADVMIVKVAPLGGVRAALAVAEQVGLPAVVSSAIDTSVGVEAGVALAAAMPELPLACGLATVALLDGDVATTPALPQDGALPVRGSDRLDVDPDLLERHAAPVDRVAWWRDRLTRCHALLADGARPTGS